MLYIINAYSSNIVFMQYLVETEYLSGICVHGTPATVIFSMSSCLMPKLEPFIVTEICPFIGPYWGTIWNESRTAKLKETYNTQNRKLESQRLPITTEPLSDTAASEKIVCQMTNNKTPSGAGGAIIRVSDGFNKTLKWETKIVTTRAAIYISFRHEKLRKRWKGMVFSREDEREDEEWKFMNCIWTGNDDL